MTVTPTIGRIVQYVPTAEEKEKWNHAETAAAIVTNAFSPTLANLQVVTDSETGFVMKRSVQMDATKQPGTWHWPVLPK